MVVLPGRALFMIPIGALALLGELLWGRHLRKRLRNEVRSVAGGALACGAPEPSSALSHTEESRAGERRA
jgi:hypothetical protein